MLKYGSVNNYLSVNIMLISLIVFVLVFFPFFDDEEHKPAAFIL